MTTADRVTRVSSELFDSAALEGARQSRSAKQQLDHWIRVGREVSAHNSAARRRIEATVAGTLPLSRLSADERVVANAEIDANIAQAIGAVAFGPALRARGVTTVSLDDAGRLVETRPDGSTHVVSA